MQTRITPIAFVAASLSIATANAAYTYFDATDEASGNTSLAAGGVLDATDTSGDTTWRQRDNAEFGDNGTVFEGVEPSPTIVTTITGLTAGESYDILVHFWDADGGTEHWAVQAGFTAGSLTTYSSGGDSDVAGSTASSLSSSISYDVAPGLFAAGNRLSYAGMVGATTADTNGEIQVFIDDLGATDVNNRTWYDGVSYQLVPEPSTALLGLLGAFGFLRRRR